MICNYYILYMYKLSSHKWGGFEDGKIVKLEI